MHKRYAIDKELNIIFNHEIEQLQIPYMFKSNQ